MNSLRLTIYLVVSFIKNYEPHERQALRYMQGNMVGDPSGSIDRTKTAARAVYVILDHNRTDANRYDVRDMIIGRSE